MGVRAKFQVTAIHGDKEKTISMQPVYTGSDENKAFFAYTPAGSISLGVVNEEACKQFEVGKEYYVDFTLAEAPAAAETPADGA